jgi:hypothetical protein
MAKEMRRELGWLPCEARRSFTAVDAFQPDELITAAPDKLVPTPQPQQGEVESHTTRHIGAVTGPE